MHKTDDYEDEYEWRTNIREFKELLDNDDLRPSFTSFNLRHPDPEEHWNKVVNVLRELFPEAHNNRTLLEVVGNLLYEGLFYTFPYEKTARILDKYGFKENDDFFYNSTTEEFTYKTVKGGKTGKVSDEERTRQLVSFNSFMANCGWYSADITETSMRDKVKVKDIKANVDELILQPGIEIVYHAKFTMEILRTSAPKFGYHVTNNFFIKPILKQGLAAKTKSKRSDHPHRIYLAQNVDDAIMLAKALFEDIFKAEKINPERDKITDIYILRIDLQSFLRDTNARLFVDNMASSKTGFREDCLWTNNPIRTQYIAQEKRISL